ncbi:MAG: patatin family protein [Peptococcaceae bacterium]|nr:patatin family protein [Peptococcaceae bacterium]
MTMIDAGLILEGGGMRGVFTAGVLDYFIDNGIYFSQIYAVSAGACHACSYISRQRGRAFRVSVNYLKDRRYCSFESLLKTGDLFGAKMLYDTIPNQLDPYDYHAFDEYPGRCYAVVTNCSTGKAEYLPLEDMHKNILAVRASSSLPLVSRNVKIDGREYLDGGIADSIPLARAIQEGRQKNVLILTRALDYRKKPNSLMPLIRIKYRKYPRLVEAIENRHNSYNAALDLIEKERQAGRAFVIRTRKAPAIGRVEKDRAKLQALYDEGFQEAAACLDGMTAFLGI